MMSDVRALMNTPLGFRTDRDPAREPGTKPYGDDILRDVLITALIDGARIVGNELNIIAGNYYRTVEQLRRRILEFPGLTDLRIDLGVPQMKDGGALVPASASWKLHGRADRLDCILADGQDRRLPIRVNKGQLIDAILGKARRKLFYRILERLTGTDLDDEREEPGTIDADCQTTITTEPAPPEPVADDTAQAGLVAELNQAETIGAARTIGERYLNQATNDDQRCAIAQAVTERENQIRAGRGARSNEPAAET
jgi:hypothetical protein